MPSAHQDKKELQRGALINFLGYGLKLANPLLLIVVAREYGADVLGDFLAIQALILVLTRALCFGLDKAVLWWVARETESNLKLGDQADENSIWSPVWSVFHLLAVFSTLISVGLFFGAESYLQWQQQSSGLTVVFQIMILGLIPAILTDILLHSLMGKKMMAPQVFIKETLVPVSMVGFAILFFFTKADNNGLAWGFLVAQWLGLIVSIYFFLKYWGFKFDLLRKNIHMPKALFQYALPLWISEVGNSFVQRMDIFALTYFVKSGVVGMPGAVGIYGIVAQFANAVRSIRRSFDPIVLAIVSGVSATKDKVRLAEGLNHAAFLVSATQLPIFAFFFCFGDWLLQIYGSEFVAGTHSIWILSFFWIINGTLGLCGVVVLGYGYSYFSLINVVLAIGIKSILLYFLIPIWGIEGAAFSVGAAYTIQGLAQFIQMRMVSGGYHFNLKSFVPLFWGVLGGVGSFGAFYLSQKLLLLDQFHVFHPHQIIAFTVFLIIYGLGMHKLYRREKQNDPA